MEIKLSRQEQLEILEQYVDESITRIEAKGKGELKKDLNVRKACFIGLRLIMPSYRNRKWEELVKLFSSDINIRTLKRCVDDFEFVYKCENPTLKTFAKFLVSQEASNKIPYHYLEEILAYTYDEFRKARDSYDEAVDAVMSSKEDSKALKILTNYCRNHAFNVYNDITSNFKTEAFELLLDGVGESFLCTHPYEEDVRKVLDVFVNRRVAYYNNASYRLFANDCISQKGTKFFIDNLKKEYRERYGSQYERGVHIGQNRILVQNLNDKGISMVETMLLNVAAKIKKLELIEEFQATPDSQENRVVIILEQFLQGRQKTSYQVGESPDFEYRKGTIGIGVAADNSDIIEKLEKPYPKKAS